MPLSRKLSLGLAALCCTRPVVLTAGQSLSSCGGPKDHLSNVAIALSPDPIRKDEAFTIVVTGDLDEDHVDGVLAADLELKALGVIDKKITEGYTYSLSPGLAKGPQKIVIGPVTLPKDPGQVVLKGQVTVKNGKGEPVMCVNLDLDVPLLQSMAPSVRHEEVSQSCAKPTDHLKNLHSSVSGKVTTTTATLDEPLTSVAVNIDLLIHALFVKIPLKLSIPVSFTPGVAQGDWKVVSSPVSDDDGALLGVSGPVSVTGQVVVTDQHNEEVTCITVVPSTAASSDGSADLVV